MSDRLRVTIFAGYYFPATGGYCLNIHELAKRLVLEGHIVKVVTCNTEDYPEDEYMDDVHIIRLPCWHLLNKSYPVPKLSYHLLIAWMGKPDVVITQTRFFATSLLGAQFAWWYGVPLIHVERGSVHTVTNSGLVSRLVRIYDHTLGAWVVQSAKVNIGVSEACSEFTFHLGGRNRKVIFNGVRIA